MLEWCAHWHSCLQEIPLAPIPDELRRRSLACLDGLARFARDGDLSALDRGLAEVRSLGAQWDHWWWVERRASHPWPLAPEPSGQLQVTRQNGRSRISWRCAKCDWSLSWDLPVPAWDPVDWPGPMECPLGCSIASCDDPRACENPLNECER
ncbi:MAG: hypothetical protein U0931_22480 [Vulcanimicrobiota bacterium]